MTRRRKRLVTASVAVAVVFLLLWVRLNKPATGSGQIPGRSYYGIMEVPVRINGKGPFDLVLDTGNGVADVDLSDRLARTIGVTPDYSRRTQSSYVFAGSGSFSPIALDEIGIGNLVVHHPISYAFPDSDAAYSEGSIGFTLLSRYVLTIDARKSTVALSASAPPEGVTVPLLFDRSLNTIVDAQVNGVPMKFVVDTGSAGTLLSYMSAQRLFGKNPGGPYVAIKSLAVAGQEQGSLMVRVSSEVELDENASRSRFDGILGMDFLGKYRASWIFLDAGSASLYEVEAWPKLTPRRWQRRDLAGWHEMRPTSRPIQSANKFAHAKGVL